MVIFFFCMNLKMVNFTHLSSSLLGPFIRPTYLGKDMKPYGCLWLSCKNDWHSFAKDEMPVLFQTYKYRYRIKVDLDKLIILASWDDVKEFHDAYAYKKTFHKYEFVDWDMIRTTTGKSGILVNAPFDLHQISKDNIMWPYTFDICSVAIWNDDCILSISKPRLMFRKSYQQ